LDRIAIADGSVSVAFKTLDGAVDQAAGIVWRYEDPNNYYIVRANAPGRECRALSTSKTASGNRAPPTGCRRARTA
jgi:hypothetical protein